MNTLYSHLAVDTNSVIKPASPQHVPQVGTNVEVMEDTMEGYLQRPHHTLNMKRTMGGTEDREASGNERTMDTTERGRRDKMFKFVHGEFQLQNAMDMECCFGLYATAICLFLVVCLVGKVCSVKDT